MIYIYIFTCNTDCSAKPIRSLPAKDRIKYLASVKRHATKSDWILSNFLVKD